MTASTTQPKQPEPARSIAEQDAAAPVNWSTKTSLVVAGCVVVFTLVILLIPWWQLQLALTLGALAYILLVKANPLRRFFFAGMSCFGVAAAPTVLPSLAAKLHIDTSVVFEFVSESSGLGQGLFALIGFGCIVLDYFYTHPRRSAGSSNQLADQLGQAPSNLVGGGNSQNQTVNVTINSPTSPSPTDQPKTIDPPDSANTSGPPFNVPNLPQHYVARETKLEELHAALFAKKEPGVALWAAAAGHGGQGKSILAIGYAHRFREQYPGGCFWLPSENARPISAMAKLDDEMGLARSVNEQASAETVKRTLESAPLSLLILDNIVGHEQWKQWNDDGLVPSANCHVMVTSRQRGLPKLEEIKVARLTAGEARDLLDKFKPFEPDSADADAADKIAEHVGYLAVAVAAIGVKVKRTPGATYVGYWEDLKTRPQLAIPETDDVDKDHLEYEKALSDIIDDAFDALDAVQQRMIQYAALLPEDMIPKSWLRWLVEHDEELTLPDVAGVPGGAAAGALAALMEDDVLRPADEDGNLVSLHRLWAHRVQTHFAKTGEMESWFLHRIGACADSRVADILGEDVNTPKIMTDPTYRWELPPLGVACRLLWERGSIAAVGRLSQWVASVLHDMGQYSNGYAALAPFIEHEVAYKEIFGESQLGTCYSNLALNLIGLGDLPEAQLRMESAIALWEQAECENPQRLATGYSNLAMILQDLGDLRAARSQMERAIEIDKEAYAPDHPKLATRYSNMAMILKELGDLLEARSQIERAISIDERALAADHPTLAIRYSNLATILQDLGDLSGARERMERAIEILERAFEGRHPTLATCSSNLALILKGLGDLTGARAQMERAIEINENAYEADHPKLATSYSNLALLLNDLGDLSMARVQMERAIAINEQVLDEDHPVRGRDYSNLATILQDLGDLSGAREQMERAIEICEKVYDADHPTLATGYHNMAGIEATEKNFAAAVEWETQANRILHQHFDNEHPHVQISDRVLALYKARLAEQSGDLPPPGEDA